MKPFRAIACSAAVVSALAVQAPHASATVVHERESTHRVVTSEHDLNICGDLATFTFESTGHSTSVDTGKGFHFSLAEVAFYTVDFDDPALGTWTARATETIQFNATPGDAVTLHLGYNNIEGDVRIREFLTLVIGPDGAVRVERTIAQVVGC
jgi:hypothetical protein